MNSTQKTRRNLAGFTLLELLVVMTIIAVLAAVGLSNYSRSLSRGRDARRRSDLKTIQNALEQYYLAKSLYPGDTTGSLLRSNSDLLNYFSESQLPVTIEGGNYCDVNQAGGDQSPGRVFSDHYWCCEKLEQAKGNADLANDGTQPTPAASGQYYCIYNLQ